MSRYAWERGTIKLPTADVTRVKKAVRDANNALHERRYELAREAWRKLSRTRDAYDVLEGMRLDDGEFDALHDVLEAATHRGRMPGRGDIRPARATNKTNAFAVGHDATIRFARREVTWSVRENNHAVESARWDPLGKAFFTALGRVRWTRGSGGQIVGNDEYNRDSDYAGGGSNYVTAEFGAKARR
jgi:hypothetical protein